ncbi:MAG TPA: 6-carboxytetrahydropterin synthase QueD [candidate division Zixibacteria bacterium]|nr:6-carboxytetrahydropterin synthase QueD [candidate division Zixibacteria bacterium]
MYEVFIKTHFSAAHHLRDYTGKCANQHGHNWLVEVYCRCEELDRVGMALDFVDLKREVNELLESLDHKDLNELEYFKKHNPTSENLAKFLFDRLAEKLDDERVRVMKVVIYETPNCGASFSRA